MSKSPSVSYTVMCQGDGLLARKYLRALNEAAARAFARTACRDGWTSSAYIIKSERGTGTPTPNTVIAFYTAPDGEDETVKFYRLQQEPFTLPPPSPLDDLGEEE